MEVGPVILLLVVFFLLIILRVPVAVALGLTALLGMLRGGLSPTNLVSQAYSGLDTFTLLAVPFFLATGFLVSVSSLSERLLALARVMVGRIRGALGHVNIVVSMLFAGISGSATADTAGVGSVLIPMMRRRGYPAHYAAAITAASSTVGLIIPPSVVMIIYGAFSDVSVGALFLAGVLPGILVGLGFLILNFLYTTVTDIDGAEKPDDGMERDTAPRARLAGGGFGTGGFRLTRIIGKESEVASTRATRRLPAWRAIQRGIPALFVPAIIIFGITSGVFTPTEAGLVAFVYLLLLLGVFYREVTARLLFQVGRRSLLLYALPLFAAAMAVPLGWVLSLLGAPTLVRELVTALNLGPFGYLLIVITAFLIIGAILDAIPAIVIFAPLFQAGAVLVGIHPIHLGLIICLVLAIGLVTPPYGLCYLIATRLANARSSRTLRIMMPFIAIELVIVVVFASSEMIALAIPRAWAPHLF